MAEKKKLIILGIVALAIVALIPIVYFGKILGSKKEYEKFQEYIQTSEAKMLYVGRAGCPYCVMYQPEVEFLHTKYDFESYYIDTDKLTESDLGKILTTLEIDGDDFGTPYTVAVKDGEKLADEVGYMTDYQTFSFLKDNGIIASDSKYPLDYLDLKSYKKVIAEKTSQIVVIGQSGCDGCTAVRPILWDLVEDYDLPIHYLNGSELTPEEGEEFEKTLAYFTEEGIATPLVMIVKDGKVIDVVRGAENKATYVSFFKKNGFIKE